VTRNRATNKFETIPAAGLTTPTKKKEDNKVQATAKSTSPIKKNEDNKT